MTRATTRQDYRNCTACGEPARGEPARPAIVITQGSETLTRCEKCAAALVRVVGREMKRLQEA